MNLYRICLAKHNWTEHWINCSCLPLCDSIDYDIREKSPDVWMGTTRMFTINTYVNKSRVKRDLLFSIDFLVGKHLLRCIYIFIFIFKMICMSFEKTTFYSIEVFFKIKCRLVVLRHYFWDAVALAWRKFFTSLQNMRSESMENPPKNESFFGKLIVESEDDKLFSQKLSLNCTNLFFKKTLFRSVEERNEVFFLLKTEHCTMCGAYLNQPLTECDSGTHLKIRQNWHSTEKLGAHTHTSTPH